MKKRYTEEQIIGFLKKPTPTPINGRVTGVARLLVGCGVGLALPSATNGSAELTFPTATNGSAQPTTEVQGSEVPLGDNSNRPRSSPGYVTPAEFALNINLQSRILLSFVANSKEQVN